MKKTAHPNAQKNRELVRQGIMVTVAFVLVLVTALAWFISVRTNTGFAPEMQAVDLSETKLILYHILEKDENGNILREEKVDNIEILNYVPNQSESYRLEIENLAKGARLASINFEDVTADFVLEDPDIIPDPELAKAIEATGLSCDSSFKTPNLNPGMKDGGAQNSLYQLYGGESAEKRDIAVADTLYMAPEGKGSVYFTFHMKQDASNYYQQKAIKIGKVTVSVQDATESV